MKKEQMAGHGIALVCIVIWSSVIIFTKILLQTLKPADILFWRFLIGYLTLWIIYPHPLRLKNKRSECIFLICGLTGVNLYFYLQNSALQNTRASDVSIIICIAPMFTAILQQIVNKKKKCSLYFYFGFIIAILGIICVCSSGAKGSSNIGGIIMTLCAGIAWAIYSVSGELLANDKYPVILCIRRYFFYGLLTMIPMLLLHGMTSVSVVLRPEIMGSLCYMGIGASAMAYVLWNISTKKIGIVQTNLYLYLIPIMTIIISAIVLEEQITRNVILGTVLTIVGLILSEKRRSNE